MYHFLIGISCKGDSAIVTKTNHKAAENEIAQF